VRPATAYIWRGSLRPTDAGATTSARLVAYTPGLPRLRLRLRLRRETVDAIRYASTRATFRREGYGTWRDPQHAADWPESRTHLRPLAEWLRGGR
jgi:hypothetical protein